MFGRKKKKQEKRESALSDLREHEAVLEAYAQERGLTLRLDPAFPGAPPPEQQPGPIKHSVWSLIGRMPGGTVGKLRHQATFGQMMGMDARMQHTIFAGRLPETVAWVPMLNLRPAKGGGMFSWEWDSRPRQQQEFESIEMNRRYEVDVAEGQDQQWLFRLFTPTLINWIAHETSADFGFRLDSGSFDCEAPQSAENYRKDRLLDTDHLDMVAAAGGRVAGRIRDEIMEQVELGGVPVVRSAESFENWANAEDGNRWSRMAERMAGVEEEDDSAARFAAEHGFSLIDIPEFHAANVKLPLPGVATDAFAGEVGGRPGNLLLMEYESQYFGLRYYVGVAADLKGDPPTLWFDRDEVVAANDLSEEGLPPAAMELVEEAGCGITSGGGRALVYISATGWEGRPSRVEIEAMMAKAPAIFDAVEASG